MPQALFLRPFCSSRAFRPSWQTPGPRNAHFTLADFYRVAGVADPATLRDARTAHAVDERRGWKVSCPSRRRRRRNACRITFAEATTPPVFRLTEDAAFLSTRAGTLGLPSTDGGEAGEKADVRQVSTRLLGCR
jgi:hypothetical protein